MSPHSTLGPAGAAVSADGRHLYVALEADGALAVFEAVSDSDEGPDKVARPGERE